MVPGPRQVRRRTAIGDAQYALDNVIDIGEIARVVAIVEHVNRLAGKNLAGKMKSAMSGGPHGP